MANHALPLMAPNHQLTWLEPLESLDDFAPPTPDWSNTDAAWVYRYLSHGCSAPATRKAVQGEMLRLAYFMKKTGVERLADLTSDHAAAYRNWLASNKEAHEVNRKPVLRIVDGQINPDWRPFRSSAPLAINAQKTALRLISGCLAFMQDDPSCPVQGNPFRRVAKAVERSKKVITDVHDDAHLYTKALSQNGLDTLFAYVNSKDFKGSERSRIAKRWLLTLLSETAVRVETLSQLSTENLFADPANPDKYRLRFRAKHNSRVDQPWPSNLMDAFQDYCQAFDITFNVAESIPFWFGVKTIDPNLPCFIRPSSAWALMRTLGKQTLLWANQKNAGLPRLSEGDVKLLKNLHPHTLRHTWCTLAVNNRGLDLQSAKLHMGHSSITVTERYLW